MALGMVNIREGGYFQSFVNFEETLRSVIIDYFGLHDIPSFASFCAYIGATPLSIKDAVSPNSGVPIECRELLDNALMHIEAYLNEAGLTEQTNPAFTKFHLNTYHGRSEKMVTENRTSSISVSFTSDGPTFLPLKEDPVASELEQKMLSHIGDTHKLISGAQQEDHRETPIDASFKTVTPPNFDDLSI